MPKPTIAIINESTVVKDSEVTVVVQALQIQVSNHFAPIYGMDAKLVQVRKGQAPPAGSWWLVILDNSDQAGDLGYHDVTVEELPIGKVFAATDLQYGNLWSVTASHELLEMLGDPGINRSAQGPDGLIYAWETADAVEDDDLGYYVLAAGNKTKVSDFVYPAWWGDAPGKMDYCGHVVKPLQLAPGGYIGVLDPQGSGWTIRTADMSDKTLLGSRAPVGSRRDRRRTPRSHWLKSTSFTVQAADDADNSR